MTVVHGHRILLPGRNIDELLGEVVVDEPSFPRGYVPPHGRFVWDKRERIGKRGPKRWAVKIHNDLLEAWYGVMGYAPDFELRSFEITRWPDGTELLIGVPRCLIGDQWLTLRPPSSVSTETEDV